MSCELRTDATFLEKYWNLVIESTGFQTVVLAKNISEKVSWECGVSFSSIYKLGMVVVVKLIGSLDEVLKGLEFLQFYMYCISTSACFLKPLQAEVWNQLPAEICLIQFAQGSLHWLPWGVVWENAWCWYVHECSWRVAAGDEYGNRYTRLTRLCDLFWMLYIS